MVNKSFRFDPEINPTLSGYCGAIIIMYTNASMVRAGLISKNEI